MPRLCQGFVQSWPSHYRTPSRASGQPCVTSRPAYRQAAAGLSSDDDPNGPGISVDAGSLRPAFGRPANGSRAAGSTGAGRGHGAGMSRRGVTEALFEDWLIFGHLLGVPTRRRSQARRCVSNTFR
jgi:hypothetical protein